MFKKLTPNLFVNNFLEITPEIIKNMGCRAVFVDLDGTLVSKDVKKPTADVENWIQSIKSENIEFVLLSNNKYERVHEFAKDLNVTYFAKAKKPLAKGFKLAKETISNDIKSSEIAMIGDQIYTDAWVAKNNKAKSIYVYPIDVNSKYVKFRLNFTEKSYLRGFESE